MRTLVLSKEEITYLLQAIEFLSSKDLDLDLQKQQFSNELWNYIYTQLGESLDN